MINLSHQEAFGPYSKIKSHQGHLFETLPRSLQKNDKFQFLLSELQNFSSKPAAKKDKFSIYYKKSEDWKNILYKKLRDLLHEASQIPDPKIQDCFLSKIQSWYFNNLNCPKTQEDSHNTLLYQFSKPAKKAFFSASVHQKSSSLNIETRIKLTNEYQQSLKNELIHFGSTEARSLLLRLKQNQKSKDLTQNFASKTPEPATSKLIKKAKLPIIQNISNNNEKISKPEPEIRDIQSPIGFDRLGEGSRLIKLEYKFPEGGEYLLRAPIKQPIKVAKILF